MFHYLAAYNEQWNDGVGSISSCWYVISDGSSNDIGDSYFFKSLIFINHSILGAKHWSLWESIDP